MIFHLHIPKTGGTTAFAAMERRTAPGRVALVAADAAAAKHFADDIGQMDVVSGHLPWGAIAAFPRPPAVLTVLRDPVERTLSHYSYLRGHPAPDMFTAGDQHLVAEAATRSLSDILLDPLSPLRAKFFLVQVDFLSSASPVYQTADVALDEREVELRLETAMRNLASCAWVGTTETLDRDLQTLAHSQGWDQFIVRTRHGVTPERLDASALTVRARRELERLVAADRELHARARVLADERYEAMRDEELAGRAGSGRGGA
jgi:hypothetical protein